MNQELRDMVVKAETEFTNGAIDTLVDQMVDEVKAFAALVAVAEREKVAKQWEQWHGFDKHTVAAFIRARGETK
jgi:hypothetical protein